jgi:hypothetical protein
MIPSNFLHELDNSMEKLTSETPRDDNKSDEHNNTLNDTQIRVRKRDTTFVDVKANMERFLDSFNSYFYDEIFSLIVEKVEGVLEEKNKKALEIAKNYNDQIKEMEFLINSGNFCVYL